MSLYGVMRTGVSGMIAQANRLSSVAENIANVNTTGYKRSSCEFSSLVLASCQSNYESGSVNTIVRQHVSTQGNLLGTSSASDLAIRGDGFFVVKDPDGTPVLTRAGAFVMNGDGELVNSGGYTLLGYRLDPEQPDIAVNGFDGLTTVNFRTLALAASPSRNGTFTANLPADATAIASTDLPSQNTAGAAYTAKSSLITYGNLGGEAKLDFYFTKSAENTWELAVFDSAEAATSGFPYATGPLATATLQFDPVSGRLTGGGNVTIPIPDGQDFTLDLGEMSQLSTPYTVLTGNSDGHPPSGVDVVEIARDGTVYSTYENGTRVPVYRIPLARVTSADMLQSEAGNVFRATAESGGIQIGFAESGGAGSIISGALESSTVDLATELTSMIDSQRSYTANSKVFQTGSELMDVLVNLKR